MQSPTLDTLKEIWQAQRDFFDAGNTLEYRFRLESLAKLKKAIQNNREDIIAALHRDFRKPRFETYTSEIGVLIDEINYLMKHLRSWMQPKSITTPITLLPAHSRIYYEPKGVVVIFAPWNYPFQLMMTPLAGAIAAGNTVILKPAHETPHTAALLEKIVRDTFDPRHVSIVRGVGSEIGPMLLDNFRFDHIFFTGSPATGKWAMAKAAENLTPVTLELGGKSPVIVDKDVNLNAAVERITWAKFFNAGQTCIAPDYILVHKEVKEAFVEKTKRQIEAFFGDQPEKSPDFARLVSQSRFQVVQSLLSQGKILEGGTCIQEENYIAPTLLEVNELSESIMSKEIFGPVMPLIVWEKQDELLAIIRKNRYPLTCYIYSNNRKLIDFIIRRVEFGSGCVNNSMIQYANNEIPFGGIQFSGLGRYHGKYSFRTFSNEKGVMFSPTWISPSYLFAPYNNFKMKLARFFLE